MEAIKAIFISPTKTDDNRAVPVKRKRQQVPQTTNSQRKDDSNSWKKIKNLGGVLYNKNTVSRATGIFR